MKTFNPTPHSIQRKWLMIDAEGKILGRLACEIAKRLRGKDKAIYTPNMDTGDYIVVINADKVSVSGRKQQDKLYKHYTGYPGGLKTKNFEQLMQARPERAIEIAVKGMLPKGPLGRAMFRKLKVYAGGAHPHAAQQPEQLDIIK
jgi:large subunit ribosomal protein L13